MFPRRGASPRLLVTDHEGDSPQEAPRRSRGNLSHYRRHRIVPHSKPNLTPLRGTGTRAPPPSLHPQSAPHVQQALHTRDAALRTKQPYPGKMPRDWSGAHTRPAPHWPLSLISGTSLVARRRRALYPRRLEWAGLPARVRAEEAYCREPGAAARAATGASGRLRSVAG